VPFDQLLPEPVIPGEDCLNLNIWTPDPGRAGLPVLVWIHGGAFVNGSGAVAQYQGGRFARDGVVTVTINYRLGTDGFLFLDDGIANTGLLDQVAALEWVHENIAGFGGDPDKVTIAGESAGGMSVTTLLSMPRTDGLFGRVIAQSGAGHHSLTPGTAAKVGRYLAEKLGVEPTREAIAGVPIPDLLAAQQQLSMEAQLMPDPERWGEVTRNLMPFEPVVDGDVLPAAQIEGIAAGTGAGVDLLIGSNVEENRLFMVPNGVIDAVTDDMVTAAASGLGLSDDAIAQYRNNRPGATPGDVLAAINTDWFFRIPAIRAAEARVAHGGDGGTWVYELSWRSPLFDGRLGACHALEIPFAFDTLDTEGAEWLTRANPPGELAAAMHGAWVQFISTGDPDWQQYNIADRTTMRFDISSQVVANPRAGERQIWDGIR
jgi:para-nitrobenzyl esterase